MNISAVIPCHNEEASIARVIQAIRPHVAEIIVVDNNSTDKTAQVARDNGAHVVAEPISGYGAAIQRGLREAGSDWILVLDGDGQYPGELVGSIGAYAQTKGLDFVSCSRFPLKEKNAMPRLRYVGNMGLTWLINLLFKIRLRDSQSGMWLFKKLLLQDIRFENTDMAFSEEIKLKVLEQTGNNFEEYPIPYYERKGVSKLMPIRDGIKNAWYIIIFWIQSRRPLFLGIIPILCVFVFFAWPYFSAPFNHLTADVNGSNGIAAKNLLEHGLLTLRFGVHNDILRDSSVAFGSFYTHHPAFFILPTVFSYTVFGVSEWSTRLPTFLWMMVGIISFGYALEQIFKNKRIVLLILLSFVMLPGAVFYGMTLELAVYSLPSALLSFSFFTLFLSTKKNLYLYLFFGSIALGSLLGWFYYFMPVSIWLFLIGSKKEFSEKRRLLLLGIPATLLMGFLFNFAHFYILNGNIPMDLVGPFLYRAGRPPLFIWLDRFSWVAYYQLGITFVVAALLGIPVLMVLQNRFPNKRLLLPLFLFPFLIVMVFFQWSMHPFGFIFFLPLVATLAGVFSDWCLERFEKIGIVIVVILFLVSGYNTSIGVKRYFEKFILLGGNDIVLLKEIPQEIADGDVCLGGQSLVNDMRGIVEWYLEKKTMSCSSVESRFAIAFRIATPDAFTSEIEVDVFKKNGYTLRLCGTVLCLMERKSKP